jgi:two-component system, OmpR family, phosphate regulon response regulator PhoB
MQSARILIVEDEPGIAELVAANLRHHGYAPLWACDADTAQREFDALAPDAVVLDWMLPDASGCDLARRWRARDRSGHLGILMLTARVAEADKIAALDAGADDYLTKPFSPNELVARLRALLRRCVPSEAASILCVDALQLDAAAHRVLWKGRMLRLGPAEYRLLHFLMQHPEQVHSRGELLRRLWGDHLDVEERTVDVHVKRLRDALGPARELVETVRGAGYRITAQPLVSASALAQPLARSREIVAGHAR